MQKQRKEERFTWTAEKENYKIQDYYLLEWTLDQNASNWPMFTVLWNLKF